MSLTEKIDAAKAEFDAIWSKEFPTAAEFHRMGTLGSKLYRLRKQQSRPDA